MTASTRAHYGPTVLAAEVGLQRWQFERASAAGMLPPPGHARGWLPGQVESVRALVPAVVARFGAEHPIGAARCAARLSTRLDLDAQAADIKALASTGHLEVVEAFESGDGTHDLYAPAAVDVLAREQVEAVIAERTAWAAASLSFDEVCARLGWHRDELDVVVRDRQITRGRFGRFRIEDVEELANDDELEAQILDDRLMTADAAADRLDVARRHFDIVVEAGWIHPKLNHQKQVGRYKTVIVPLYRTGDIDVLLELPDVDWAAVRETRKGERSPLLDVVGGRRPTRAKVIRAFLRDFGTKHSIEMWGWWLNTTDQWEIDWERIDGGPTKADVAAAIAAHPGARAFQHDLVLHSAAGAAIRFARTMLEPGRAVILDTETTDLHGAICEIAVIDACTGKTLLDTLVNPGVPIEPGAFEIHGITDSEVTAAGVPDWPTVYKRLLRVTKDRIVLAYNADYDRGVVTADCERAGIHRTRLAQVSHWADVMIPRSDHAHAYRWLANGGGHRALGDVQQTRQHLLRMTAP